MTTSPNSNAQLRTQVKDLSERLAALEAEHATTAKRARVLESWMSFAEGFTFRLANPSEMIRVQTNGYGRWAIFLNGRQRAGAWTGTEWGPFDADYAEMYRWQLLEALSAAAQLTADDFAEHEKWLTERVPIPTLPDEAAADSETAEAVA